MARIEDFPISDGVLDKFIRNNSWNVIEEQGKCILVNLSMVRMQVSWVVPKLIYTKGIQEATNAKVYVVTWRPNDKITELINSFGFIHICLDEMIFHNPSTLIKAIYQTCKFELIDGTGEGLKQLSVDDNNIGRALYEDILRTSSLSTISNARKKIVIKKMVHLLAMYYAMKSFLRKKNLIYAVIDDIAYHEGMLIKLFHKQKDIRGILQVNSSRERIVELDNNENIVTTSQYLKRIIDQVLPELGKEDYESWIEQYFQNRFQGKNGRAIDRGAFAGKKVLSRDELVELLGLNPDKKNVVIMAHTFTDAVFNYGEYFFKDYYDWTEKTLELAKDITDVNWILKPHPTRHAYNEEIDSIEDMFLRVSQGCNHMFMLDDGVSSEAIKNFADVLVTIGGNAGVEYACFGVPAIIIGKPYYSGHGFTIEPEDYEQYSKLLRNVATIDKLSDAQIEEARKVFYVRNSDDMKKCFPYIRDEFADRVNERYMRMVDEIALQYFSSNQGTQRYNDEACEAMSDYFETHDMSECAYYKLGFSIVDRI